MRQLIMDALVFPRQYIRSNLDLSECVHAGNFMTGDSVCESCRQKEPCLWLYFNDECSDTNVKSVDELLQALEFSLDYIDTNAAQQEHNIGTCSCKTCMWIKNAENLLNLYNKSRKSTH